MKTLKNFTIIGVAIIISATINFFTITSLAKSERVYTQIMFDINDSFTEEKVKIYLKELNIKYPDVALAQMKLESANGTSKVFKENNNLFGMKLPKFRPTTALGEKNNHSYYSHWRQSVVDYAIWQSFVMNPENVASEKNWVEYLNRMYAEDGSYGEKILLIRNKIKSSE
jgi:flagellum-specific peptidoglycan hydrolase FlgJ